MLPTAPCSSGVFFGTMTPLSKPVRRIAVIGAGASGLAAVKYLLAENYFEKVDVFEKRSSAGGVWNHCPGSLKATLSTPVPQLNPNNPCEEPAWCPTGNDEILQPIFVSPVYKTLDANLPKEMMAYGEKKFPPDVQDLPRHFTVREYLEEYAKDVKKYIQFETQVLDVRIDRMDTSTWSVITKNLRTGIEKSASYDAVVVASGHFDVPYLPDISGIKAWNEAYPGIISHSKFFDSPDAFRDKKVIVIGSSASGLDIGNQINEVSKGKVLASQRTKLYLSPSTATDKAYFPEIVEFLSPATNERAVRFADDRIEKDIDAVVFCTGYLYSFPFLSSLEPPVITDGRRTLNTYQHLFYIYNPTLVFPILPQRIIPFPLSENQAAVFSRIWSGRLTLPSTAEMEAWEAATVAQKGNGNTFHLLPFPLDADYMNMFHDWAATARPRQGLVNNGNGKPCNLWGEEEKWMRQECAEIRRVFAQKGEARRSIKSLKELGYDFEKWKDEQQHYP